MITLAEKSLTLEEINKLSSKYFIDGRIDELWEILSVEIGDKLLTAKIRMKSIYISPTDIGGFHLTQLSTYEFLSQLTIIYAHILGGYTEKTKECWMRKSSITCRRAIRNPNNITVKMELASLKNIKGQVLITTKSKIYDENGLFEGMITGVIS